MNFSKVYYDFKRKWYLKIGTILLDTFTNNEINANLSKNKYIFLDRLVTFYIEDSECTEEITISSENLNTLEVDLLKKVTFISKTLSDIEFRETDLIYYTVILELTIYIYNMCFDRVSSKELLNILKDNLFRFEFINPRRKDSSIRLLLNTMNYISKKLKFFFSNLNNKGITISLTSLTKYHGYYICSIKNNLLIPKVNNNIIDAVDREYNLMDKLFILNFNILIQELIYLKEVSRIGLTKIIYNIDYHSSSVNTLKLINVLDDSLKKNIILVSKYPTRLNYLSRKYDRYIYINDIDNKNEQNYLDMNLLLGNTDYNKIHNVWKNKNYLVISDNITYKFEEE